MVASLRPVLKEQKQGQQVAAREQLAWAAGFVDGEGSFTANKNIKHLANGSTTDRRYLRLTVAQKEPELLYRLRDVLGVGCVYRAKRDDRREYCHMMECNGVRAFRAAALIWPWLGERKKSDFKRALKASLTARREAGVIDRMEAIEQVCAETTCQRRFASTKRRAGRFCSVSCYQRTHYRDVKKPRLIAEAVLTGTGPRKKGNL